MQSPTVFEIQVMEMVAPTTVNTEIQTSKYCNVADLGVLVGLQVMDDISSHVLYVFDYLLTLEPEVRWTWNRRHHSCSFCEFTLHGFCSSWHDFIR
ncbi:hypothetical protein BDR06DRAFT_953560 [Suillus hirtellus]|nr:hypothetical protein BDR06DRAFT_953560 [Suillus hirtellus]